MSDIEIYRALPADEREELGFAQWRKYTQITTHFPGCYDHGQHHYQCARTEIMRLQESTAQPVQPVQPESLPAFDVEVAMERLCKVAFTAGADDVVEALRAELLAAAALPTPLTDEQIGKAWAVADGEHNASASVKRRITRAIEQAHGIGVKP